MSSSFFPVRIDGLVLVLLILSSCKFAEQLTKPKILTSSDGKVQFTVPVGWRQDSSLHEQALLGASNRLIDAYAIVLTDDKRDFVDDMTLDKYTEITRNQKHETIESAELSPVTSVSINGREGRQYDVQGVVDNMKIYYLITIVETPSSYHQMFTWTLRSKIERNRSVLKEIPQSFRELR